MLCCVQGYAPIVNDFEDFYTRRLYQRIHDCWNRPIASCPGAYIDVIERAPLRYGQPLTFTGQTRHCLNLGSYNYLGFGDPDSPTKDAVLKALASFPVSTCSTRMSIGTSSVHAECEQVIARYIGKEAAMVYGMGFGTNSTVLPALMGKECLLVSDSTNHSSIAVGARGSGATIKVFRHNDIAHLEQVIRRAILDGQPRSHRPWRKVMIMVEGIYSMEGEMCPIRQIVDIKNRYKCFLYVDEAHSIGAIGQHGRGICEHASVDVREVDVMMGTFTKSFGAVGGYIAASAAVIAHLRHACAGSVYSASISIPACQQVISAMRIIMGEDGTSIGQTKLKSPARQRQLLPQAPPRHRLPRARRLRLARRAHHALQPGQDPRLLPRVLRPRDRRRGGRLPRQPAAAQPHALLYQRGAHEEGPRLGAAAHRGGVR